MFGPKVKLRTRQFPNWFTPQLRHLHKCLHTLQRKSNKHPTSTNLLCLSKAQESACIAAKCSFEHSLIQNLATKNDSKIFCYIKEFTRSHVLPSQLNDDSSTAYTEYDKAELLNQYFYSVFTQSNSDPSITSNLSLPANHLDSILLTVQDVFEGLNNLDPNKASGIDNIPPTILKHCAYALALPIHHLFTISVHSEIIPTEWKLHKIICSSIQVGGQDLS